MSYVYTVIIGDKKQTYEGFRRPTIRSGAQVLGIVYIYGEAAVWELDPDNIKGAIEELERYYRSEHGYPSEVVMYRRTT